MTDPKVEEVRDATEIEPETPNGIVVDELDGTQRAATDEEARAWADEVVARGTLAADHPSVILARTGERLGFLA